MTTRLAIWGALGRMGRAIESVVAEEVPGAVVVTRVDRDLPAPAETDADVVVDFSTAATTGAALGWARDRGLPFVSGTTGLDDATARALLDASGHIPVLHASNMSVGVAVVRALVRQAAAALPRTFEAEIVDIHHGRKQDAPSGTAVSLAEDIESAREGVHRVLGRAGHVGPRPAGELGIHALRGGDVVGDHTVYFLGAGERVEIAHRATDRRIFARGAVAAATWIVGREPGLYTIEDVLGL